MPMSIIYNDTQEKSELQRRITAELRAKQQETQSSEHDLSLTGWDEGQSVDHQSAHELSTASKWAIALVVLGVLTVLLFMVVVH